jgi:two-component system sensor histidine kinase TctE
VSTPPQRGRLWRGLPGAHSLQRQLLLWVLLPQGVLWLAAAFVAYDLALRHANEAIDASLVQASRALARQIKPTASGLYVDFPRSAQEIFEADPTDRVLYSVSSPPGQLLLGDPHLPVAHIADAKFNEPYLYDAAYPESERPGHTVERVRVAAMLLRFGLEGTPDGTMLVQVARSRANREALARRILIDTVLPLSMLIALMTVVVWTGIGAGLRPLAALRGQVEGRRPNDLAPIELEAAPREVRALASALNTLLAEVRRSVATQKRFIGDAAHQLRTPLAGLKSQTELALGQTDDPALQERLQRVHASATRASRLVAQLLVLARAEPESAVLQDRTRVDLAQLARATTAELVPRALAAGIDLGYDEGSDDAAVANGTALLLREALVNLLDNVLHYAGQGASATVRVHRAGGTVTLEVEDSGPGVPAEMRERVFERFVRGTQEGAGCGLGLAIVREIVERHDGRVELDDAPGGGARFRIRLPAT